ncbi:MAG: hypothetical protein ACKORJ_05830, partial [Bacteroidota bacterium]
MSRLLLLLVLLIPAASFSQKQKKEAAPAPKFNADSYKGLKWRNIGPFRGGRANAIAGVVQNDQVYYTGYTGGGIWKTEDAGKNWKNISDGFFTVGTIGKIAVS